MKPKCFMSSQAAPQGQLSAFQWCPLPGGRRAELGVFWGSPQAWERESLGLLMGPGPRGRKVDGGETGILPCSPTSSF